MKCPRCGWIVNDDVPRCRGCGFSLDRLDQKLGSAPPRGGLVDDQAGVFSAADRAALEQRLRAVSDRGAGELVVATRRSTAPVKPSEYVFWLFNRWALGGPQHRGALLLLALKERRIESEVGAGWEPIASDLETGAVLDRHALPLLREGRHAEALLAAIDALITIFLPEPETDPSSPETR